jgi:hypothetical protein
VVLLPPSISFRAMLTSLENMAETKTDSGYFHIALGSRLAFCRRMSAIPGDIRNH